MYYGGEGYYETCLSDPRFHAQRSPDGKPTSIFELENEHWRILGLDTGWVDVGLWPEQKKWLRSAILDAAGKNQSVLLLSHHQLFSAFGGHIDPELEAELGDLLRDHQVRAWFWGHEHRCTLYKPTPEVDHARCIGNGGVPANPAAPGGLEHPEMVEHDYEETGPADSDGERWVRFAFAMLEFDGPELRVTYVDEDGTDFYPEAL
jgi:3',5'-cyclic AMP phosphodiesterase CpdA